MRERLYFVIPTLNQANQVVDYLLLKRIELRHIHSLANNRVDLGELPEATEFQKHDIRRSLLIGLGFGAMLGIIIGIIFHHVLSMDYSGLLIATTLIGAALGAWFSTMVGMMSPNSELKPFAKAIADGKILLIVDIDPERIEEIEQEVKSKVPEVAVKAEY